MKLIKIVVFCVLGIFFDVQCMQYFGNKKDTDTVYRYKSDLHDNMSIQQWRDASLGEVAQNIFRDEDITKAIVLCQQKSLIRRLQYEELPYPHVALARVVMTAFDHNGEAYNIHKLFCSSIDGQSAIERMPEDSRNTLSNIAEGIAPYRGSPCVFAHSERGVGIYLEKQLETILTGRTDYDTCLIQIKTSLPPCKNCQKFWGGCTKLSGHTFVQDGEEGDMRDWLEAIKNIAETINVHVEITSQAKIEDTDVHLKPFFRTISCYGDENE